MLYLRSHHPQLVYISFCPFFKSVSSQSESGLFFICPALLFIPLFVSCSLAMLLLGGVVFLPDVCCCPLWVHQSLLVAQ